jgi:3-hydroxymyristoyl/3-hydroxydecanoyl-(acyl carrier protein) dehydratase
MNKGFGNLKEDEIIEKNENSVSILFTIPKESLYFDGHFPDYPILPAVAQIDIVVNFAAIHFGTGMAVSQIKRTKFTKIISPSLSLLLKIEKKDSSLDFKLTTPDKSEIYSSGMIILMPPLESM